MANSREITPEKYHNTPGDGLAAAPGDGTHLNAPHGDSGFEDHHHAGHVHFHHATTRSLRIALVLTAGLLVVEAVGGILANSLALIASLRPFDVASLVHGRLDCDTTWLVVDSAGTK